MLLPSGHHASCGYRASEEPLRLFDTHYSHHGAWLISADLINVLIIVERPWYTLPSPAGFNRRITSI